MPACPNFRFFPGAVGSQTRFPSDSAFPRLVRRHVRRAVCPSTASTPRVPQPPAGLKTKNKTVVPPGPQGGYGMGTGYAVSGLPSGPHRPLLRLCIAQAWEHGAALCGVLRPSCDRPRAHQRRRTAGHPEQYLQIRRRQVGLWGRSARADGWDPDEPVPPPVPPLPTGGRRCTLLPSWAPPMHAPT
jgi:hypothetical protein